ncbi:hypothetical protein DFH29DRAFT_905476 [Suillus ampliporus]|nr:hypothetical protein DFH29DRAFT_905476 [Suillus ampliporus]
MLGSMVLVELIFLAGVVVHLQHGFWSPSFPILVTCWSSGSKGYKLSWPNLGLGFKGRIRTFGPLRSLQGVPNVSPKCSTLRTS